MNDRSHGEPVATSAGGPYVIENVADARLRRSAPGYSPGSYRSSSHNAISPLASASSEHDHRDVRKRPLHMINLLKTGLPMYAYRVGGFRPVKGRFLPSQGHASLGRAHNSPRMKRHYRIRGRLRQSQVPAGR